MSTPKLPKRTIKNDPFADLIPEPTVEQAEIVPPPVVENKAIAEPAIRSQVPKRAKITVVLDGGLVERIKNAAYWNPALSVAGLAETGIRIAVEKAEKEHGGPYPARTTNLRPGRPLK